jgi:hypothetical protein
MTRADFELFADTEGLFRRFDEVLAAKGGSLMPRPGGHLSGLSVTGRGEDDGALACTARNAHVPSAPHHLFTKGFQFGALAAREIYMPADEIRKPVEVVIVQGGKIGYPTPIHRVLSRASYRVPGMSGFENRAACPGDYRTDPA